MQLEAFATPQQRAVLEHVDGVRVQRPVRAFTRPVRSSRDLSSSSNRLRCGRIFGLLASLLSRFQRFHPTHAVTAVTKASSLVGLFAFVDNTIVLAKRIAIGQRS